ncbi:MAG: Cof-type HAD-IIB family hydrolase [Tannerellaceae bacterium]|jgi:Cof subfamily protein (haloacid dehalogenase superfamily)|nr:Cof-type HAD-IIB family hydrolase [Tannerellaceae bacterium]
MKCKLLVLDVDGTLLTGEKIITQGTRTALLKVQQLGIRIVLASGRPLYGLWPLAKKLELDKFGGFIMAYNGGQIVDTRTSESLFDRRIDAQMLPQLHKTVRKYGCSLFIYRDDTLITDAPDDIHVATEATLNGMKLLKVDDFTTLSDYCPHECIVSGSEKALDELSDRWAKRLAGTADVFLSETFFLEFVPPSVNKGDSLAFLIGLLGLEREEIMTIGDGVCDIPMLQLAGIGVAMANATDAVKRCADFITSSNEDEGLAVAIEQHIMSEFRAEQVPLHILNARARNALMGNLGIQYTYATVGRVEATMPVDERTRQPFGILHGGATLALAETVAGLGSMIIGKPDEMIVGMQVSGNHLSSASEGDTVRAVATILHQGRTSHVWDVNVYTSTDKLVSAVRVINCVIRKK